MPPQVFPFDGPFLGLNTTQPPHLIAPGFAQVADNVLVRDGSIRLREPHTPYVEGPTVGDLPGEVVSMVHLDGNTLQLGINDVFVLAKVWDSTNQISRLFRIQRTGAIEINTSFVAVYNDKPPTWVLANGLVYVIDGQFPVIKTNGSWAWRIGIPPPVPVTGAEGSPIPPGVSVAFHTDSSPATPTPSGTYRYAVTLLDKRFGVESNPSFNVGNFVSDGTNNLMRVKFFPGNLLSPGFSGTDLYFRVYRKNVGLDQVGFRLIYEVDADSPVPFADTLTEDAITLSTAEAGPFAPSKNELIWSARPTVAAWYKNNMYYNDTRDGNGYLVRISESDIPDHVDPTDFLSISGGGGEREGITGMAELAGQLVIGKKDSIWIVSGNFEPLFTNLSIASGVEATPQTPTQYRSKSRTGCEASAGGNGFIVVGHPPQLYFTNSKGMFLFNGVDDLTVTDLIRPTWQELLDAVNPPADSVTGNRPTNHSVLYADDNYNQVLYVMVRKAGGVPFVLAYHWGINRGDGIGGWTKIVPQSGSLNRITAIATSLGKPEKRLEPLQPVAEVVNMRSPMLLAYIGNNFAPQIYFADPKPDTGVALSPWKYRTGDIPIGRGRKVHVFAMRYLHARTSVAYQPNVFYSVDGSAIENSFTPGIDWLNNIQQRRRIGRRVETIAVGFGPGLTGDYDENNAITGFQLEYEGASQR